MAEPAGVFAFAARPRGNHMRLILSNKDARELHALMAANPDADLAFEYVSGHNATVIFAGARFTARMRRTPSAPGSFVVEDFDGRRIAEGVPDS
jgi:hypothetical protein